MLKLGLLLSTARPRPVLPFPVRSSAEHNGRARSRARCLRQDEREIGQFATLHHNRHPKKAAFTLSAARECLGTRGDTASAQHLPAVFCGAQRNLSWVQSLEVWPTYISLWFQGRGFFALIKRPRLIFGPPSFPRRCTAVRRLTFVPQSTTLVFLSSDYIIIQ